MNLAGLDLNLLLVLDALLEEHSVTRASHRLGLSQPATSNALGRLRAVFNDPLLVRTPEGMKATPRAEALRHPLRSALDTLAKTLQEPEDLDPSTLQARLRLGMTDYVALTLLPELVAKLQAEAPGLDLAVLPVDKEQAARCLMTGEIDLAIGVFPASFEGLSRKPLFTDEFVCVLRKGHPALGPELTLDSLLRYPHLLISQRGDTSGIADQVLEQLGRSRRVAVTLPHFLVAPFVLSTTDLIAVLARRVALALSGHLGLVIEPPPIEIPGFQVDLVWHPRTERDPLRAWLRGRITACQMCANPSSPQRPRCEVVAPY